MNKQIFDDFDNYDGIECVDCNNCSHYWNELCDGAKISQKKACKSFVAKRGINIPKELEKLLKRLKIVRNLCIVNVVLNSLSLTLYILWLVGVI